MKFKIPGPSETLIPLAFLALRTIFGIRLIHGTIDNVLSWARMLEFRDFLLSFDFPFPLICAVVSVYAQLIAGSLWVLGFKTREAALFMLFNFIVAIIGVHVMGGDTYFNTEPAIQILIVSFFLWVCGPGKWSIDEWSTQDPV